jgi:hypothetical protein
MSLGVPKMQQRIGFERGWALRAVDHSSPFDAALAARCAIAPLAGRVALKTNASRRAAARQKTP